MGLVSPHDHPLYPLVARQYPLASHTHRSSRDKVLEQVDAERIRHLSSPCPSALNGQLEMLNRDMHHADGGASAEKRRDVRFARWYDGLDPADGGHSNRRQSLKRD